MGCDWADWDLESMLKTKRGTFKSDAADVVGFISAWMSEGERERSRMEMLRDSVGVE